MFLIVFCLFYNCLIVLLLLKWYGCRYCMYTIFVNLKKKIGGGGDFKICLMFLFVFNCLIVIL